MVERYYHLFAGVTFSPNYGFIDLVLVIITCVYATNRPSYKTTGKALVGFNLTRLGDGNVHDAPLYKSLLVHFVLSSSP